MNTCLDWPALVALQPALAPIPPALRPLAGRTAVAAGETLCRLGDPVQSVFCVISGEIRLIRRDLQGRELILQRSRAGFFAEASLDARYYHCDVQAGEPGEVLRLPVQAFRQALHDDAGFRSAWMAHLARELRRVRAQCERLSLKGAAERIFHYIESEGCEGAVSLKQTRKAWASELGLSHEALYRTLGKLQAQGLLRIDGERIAIASPQDYQLRAAAQPAT